MSSQFCQNRRTAYEGHKLGLVHGPNVHRNGLLCFYARIDSDNDEIGERVNLSLSRSAKLLDDAPGVGPRERFKLTGEHHRHPFKWSV